MKKNIREIIATCWVESVKKDHYKTFKTQQTRKRGRYFTIQIVRHNIPFIL